MSRVQDTATIHRTDDELDRDWKPNGRRPQSIDSNSTVARSFSAELMDIFRIENSLTDLDDKVDKKKQEVNSQTSELEALERRIREMEERLNRNKAPATTGASAGTQQHLPVRQQGAPAPAQRTSRPGTAKAQQPAPLHGGAMPPTPTASEGEYELVPEPRHPNNLSSSTHTYNDSESGLETRSFADMVIVSKDGDHDS
ncbi:hypothetical protein G7054_g763 [Neopestalotiopsis clavispora]|nr:hypothetical protein G7054_g763 [Neopestalotiopsis clavispora]